jgi:outer membrane protein OmpA-like peptidoglycan-associated protein/Tol biopolymer transport system component
MRNLQKLTRIINFKSWFILFKPNQKSRYTLPHLIVFLCLLSPLGFFSQGLPPGTYTSTNKKAINNFKKAEKAISTGKTDEAEKFCLKTLEADKDFAEAYTMLGYIYMDEKKYDLASENLEKSVQIAGKFFPNNYYQLGEIYYYTGKYAQALKSFNQLLTFQRIHPDLKTKAEYLKACAAFADSASRNPKAFKPINCGPAINSPDFEYFPTVTADNSFFYFTRKVNEKNYCSDSNDQEDFYYTTKDESGKWKNSVPFREINSSCNEGAPNISGNGQFMFFTSCGDISNQYGPTREKGYGSCDIFYSDKISGKWTKPVNIGPPVNSQHWETQPSFSSDGKTLYFIRGLVGRDGKKKGDIYYSVIGADNRFSTPVKLGPNINTDESEESVFIHPDNMTLYFASNGRIGFGGMDIYMSKRMSNGEWGPAVNLGYPINTHNDENSLLVDPSGRLAYFASNREGGFGNLDIYSFDLPDEFQPEKITYAKGLVYDSLSRKPLAASFELIDLETGNKIASSFSNSNGNFLLTINANKNYMANVTKDGYLFYSEKFRMKEVSTDFNRPFILNIPMLSLDTGKTTVLKNVYFDSDKFDLKNESFPELQKLYKFLSDNPDVSIEISGHTDNLGDNNANFTLSLNRANAVRDYLIKLGIKQERMLANGYGSVRPLFPNDSEFNRQLNRRTEYRIIGTKNGKIKVSPPKKTEDKKTKSGKK